MNEAALFWVVLVSFLIPDNVVRIPQGKDYLAVGFNGKPIYKFYRKYELFGGTVIFLNPFNFFEKVVFVEHLAVAPSNVGMKQSLRLIQATAFQLNKFAVLAVLYAILLLLFFIISGTRGFHMIAGPLLIAHVFFWTLVAALTLRESRSKPLLFKGRVLVLLEALLVPAYLLNFNKRLMLQSYHNISALKFRLRALKRAPADNVELMKYQIQMQVHDALEGESSPIRRQELNRVLECLTG